MSKEVQWAFAFSQDLQKIVHISEVVKGDACNCVCLGCQQAMQARKGTEREHHFKHRDGGDCGKAEQENESALHKIAKDLLKQADCIMLPAYSINETLDRNANILNDAQWKAQTFFDKYIFKYEKSYLEYREFKAFYPDVLLENGAERLAVEIAVSHKVDEEKRRKIKEKHLPCIEIDLSKSIQTIIGSKEKFKEKLWQKLFFETTNKKWIYHYNQEKDLQERNERNKKIQEQASQEWKAGNKERQEEWWETQEETLCVSIEKNVQKGERKNKDYKEILADIDNETTKEILEKLNDEQIKPVLETEGPVLVLAGAGSGKTRVLTSRIAYLMEEKGVPDSAILAITFTNKAANEMKERLSKIVDISRAWVCTIHSMCVRILRNFASEAGISPNFSIYSETERSNIIKKSFQECDFDDEKLLKSVKFHIANAKMLGFDPNRYAQEYAGEHDIDEVTKVYTRYQKHLRENNALDFDDLLNETRLLLRKNEEAREQLAGRFRYILVDEFQDTNAVQYEIIKLLASVHGNLFAVGDDDQSIYGWRGAKIENILHFEKDFKNAKVFKLERNYRSTKHILTLANTVIHNNAHRKDKTLWTENDEGEKAEVHEAEEESGEARFIAHTIAGLLRRGYRFSDFAVLMRLNALTRALEQEFTADGIPYKVFGGFKFFERKEIKDLLAYLRLINNPFDSEAATRIINFPKRGIGAKTVETVQNYAFEEEMSFFEALRFLDDMGLSSGAVQKLTQFRALVKQWAIDSQELAVNELVKKIVIDTGMREAYADDSDESINKRANIEEFINSVDEYCRLNEGASLTDYLNQVTLASDTDDMDDGNYVTLATVHSVKGLEFRTVFVCGMEENIMPVSRAVGNDDDMEEERRLMYVAITRAKERLYLTRSKSRYLYGRREPTARSRFLKELASELDLPKETRLRPMGYGDYSDPEDYGNSAYAGGRYGSNTRSYGSYGGDRSNSAVVRSTWNGGSSYSSYPQRQASTTQKSSAFTYGGMSKPSVVKTPSGKDLSKYTLGVKVSHPKFGTGTIVGVRGTGANMILNIAFDGLGIKQLSAGLAPLTILG